MLLLRQHYFLRGRTKRRSVPIVLKPLHSQGKWKKQMFLYLSYYNLDEFQWFIKDNYVILTTSYLWIIKNCFTLTLLNSQYSL